ncbi:MAG: glucose-6-phosphate isomerase [Simkaniaceae bacterium]|nr:glucose-6-phosphate isomerase [Candidatus Sacchlamyda saccharinae]
MKKFTELPAYNRLKELSENPIDLTAKGTLTPKRIDQMIAESGGLKLFYSSERVDEPVLEALSQLAQEADVFSKMESMQAGEVINKIEGVESENRAVLHTAMRDFFDHREEREKAKNATDLAYEECEKLKKFLEEIGDRFTHLVQVGIGGSDLGPRAIYLGLKVYQKPDRNVHFISNVDPDDGAAVLGEIDLSKTLFVIVSKSGSTLETLTNEAYVVDKLKAAGLNPQNHLVAVTGKGSPMDDPSKYLASFYIWDYVGGRYSVTSMVGGVTLAFAFGMDRYLDFLRGASSMDKIAKEKDPKANLPLLSALLGIWNHNFLGLPTVAIIPYSQALSRFPAHLQQLDMESNGKHIDKSGEFVDFETGPVIWGEPGTNGQHSFYQLIHQGTKPVPLEFIGFLNTQYNSDVVFKGSNCQEKLLSNLIAQSIGLATGQKSDNPNKDFAGNRPNRILLANRLDPYTLGMILSYYEHKVAFQGFIWNINSFDQEGVQLGKVLALKMIDQFIARRDSKPIDEKGFPLGAAYFKHIS